VHVQIVRDNRKSTHLDLDANIRASSFIKLIISCYSRSRVSIKNGQPFDGYVQQQQASELLLDE